ncbi:MAG: CapA family protein [bacterium]|nr:CapA family protein [bacterium]
MRSGAYQYSGKPRHSNRKYLIILPVILLIAGFAAYSQFFAASPEEKAIEQLQFDTSLTESEKQTIRNAIQTQSKTYDGILTAKISSSLDAAKISSVLQAYVPVTNVYAPRQEITKSELAKETIYIPADTEELVRSAIAESLGSNLNKLLPLPGKLDNLTRSQIALVPADQISSKIKLLHLDKNYYLDSFSKGAIFRQALFEGESSTVLDDLKLNNLSNQDNVAKINMTGVTALTRLMMRKLSTVEDAKHFSAKIGDFLSDADITHISNEVSFKENCAYSRVLFCSPPEMIETLKDSGVDLVELTGNHNNDLGSTYNTESIKLYQSLGWKTVGGGLNEVEAAKPYASEVKGNKITFIAYNMADGANSGAIAKTTTAGANLYTETKATRDIKAAKDNAEFVIVNIQYAECQAYPVGYVEFPQCDGTIGGQQAAFQKMIDLGADMVVGSSAHQPQTYELYKGKPIYYGLGNMYFEQIQWPGTERGIILTHYFNGNKLLQTKLTPTVYDREFQPQVTSNDEAVYLLGRLDAAR